MKPIKATIIRIIIIISGLAILASLLYYANHDKPGYYTTEDSGMEYETARVLNVLEDNTTIDDTTENVRRGSMTLQLEILSGRYEGDIVETVNYFSSLYNVYVTEGDTVSIRIDTTGSQEYSVSVYNYNRTPIMIGFVVFFCAIMIIIGKKLGLKSLIGLIITIICVIFLLIPLVLKGYPPIPTTIVILTVVTFVCFAILGGLQAKMISAAIGSVIGVMSAACLAGIVGAIASVTGFHMDEAESLLMIATDTELSIKGLFICSVLIASLGAVMDIAMTISSALEELHINSPSMTRMDLFRSGMNIGRDAMGTMSNTLILAFAGSSFNMMIMLYSYGVTFTQLINTDFVAVELIRGLAGSLGIALTIPAVSFIGSWIILGKSNHNKAKENVTIESNE